MQLHAIPFSRLMFIVVCLYALGCAKEPSVKDEQEIAFNRTQAWELRQQGKYPEAFEKKKAAWLLSHSSMDLNQMARVQRLFDPKAALKTHQEYLRLFPDSLERFYVEKMIERLQKVGPRGVARCTHLEKRAARPDDGGVWDLKPGWEHHRELKADGTFDICSAEEFELARWVPANK
ncbi:hypothetical protein EXS71_00125 [Candidatus Uhrbacteria bacterium]|nr:hypothetical protein [Candidatus Uhrbacteria bacterium]